MKNRFSFACSISFLLFSTTFALGDHQDATAPTSPASPSKQVADAKRDMEKKKKAEMHTAMAAPAPAPTKPSSAAVVVPAPSATAAAASADPAPAAPSAAAAVPAAVAPTAAPAASTPAMAPTATTSAVAGPAVTSPSVEGPSGGSAVVAATNVNNNVVNASGSDTLNGPSVAVQSSAAQSQNNVPSAVSMAISGHLVMANPKGSLSEKNAFTRVTVPAGNLAPRYFLFYYSAHWCPPCRIFTPEFVDFYNNQLTARQRAELMVVFVSQDHSERDMFKYMVGTKMPWPAIAYSERQSVLKVNALMGEGIPCLVMVDRDFNVLASTDHKGRYTPPMKVLEQVQHVLK